MAEALQQMGVLQEDGVNSNDFLPNSFTSSARGWGASSACVRLVLTVDAACLPGYSYGGEELLIYPGAPLADELLERKRALAEAAGIGKGAAKTL